MTLDTYADLLDDDLDDVASALDRQRAKALQRQRSSNGMHALSRELM
jgi:hypothetical protein